MSSREIDAAVRSNPISMRGSAGSSPAQIVADPDRFVEARNAELDNRLALDFTMNTSTKESSGT